MLPGDAPLAGGGLHKIGHKAGGREAVENASNATVAGKESGRRRRKKKGDGRQKGKKKLAHMFRAILNPLFFGTMVIDGRPAVQRKEDISPAVTMPARTPGTKEKRCCATKKNKKWEETFNELAAYK